ncbi:hypothetical protein GCM10009555_081150 [Acrocarpospora macrocephala]|uniref:Bulb-type lectin domain-containing protein n=1 Tax=Acrocarpospora macrocephala TaxID=150177 RepID=A0A5M3X9Y0_9ACTN|nr:hypothetical protein [Acrocarpospora macrocephala]GES15653.1 hypothetical protein Amac_092510 [Acrocarpospora macrocephala]
MNRLVSRLAMCLLMTTAVGLVGVAPAAANPPAVGNVITLSGGVVLPVYTVTGSATVSAVGFQLTGGTLRAVDQSGTQLWTAGTTGYGPYGGFDYDADGWPDVFVVVSASTGTTCGTTPVVTTTLYFYSGQTGTRQTPLSPLTDICWNFGSTIYPTHQWTENGVLWGPTNKIAVSPYYASTSWFFGFNGSSFGTDGALYFPSTSSYDATYTNALANTYPTGTKYITNSHAANGLIVNVSGQQRLVFWTSGRVAQYAVGPLSASQLVADRPYLTGGRTDIGGRNYGVVAVDPGNSSKVVLVAGTSNYSLYLDRLSGTMTRDPWGGIERHVSVYDLGSNTVDDRFYSYAHDNSDGNKYENRVSYPANPIVRTGGTSRIAYNVYTGGRWYLHISDPGATTDRYAIKDLFLWDIADVDGDGVDDWLVSPTRDAGEPDVPGYYYPKWQTNMYHWNESTASLTNFRTEVGYIPHFQQRFNRSTATSSDGYLTPAQTYLDGSQLKLMMINSAGTVSAR